jgi:tRNA(Arg) A34 adenosine deaminase TadA
VVRDEELSHARRCVELATEALRTGNKPFGSVLVSAGGKVCKEDHNRAGSGDPTHHPEFELARYSAVHLSADQRTAATVFTSGEHCPMCSAAHGWVGLGRIVYLSSSEQLQSWLAELEIAPPPVRPLPIHDVVPNLVVEGPIPELAEQVRDLHRRYYQPDSTIP